MAFAPGHEDKNLGVGKHLRGHLPGAPVVEVFPRHGTHLKSISLRQFHRPVGRLRVNDQDLSGLSTGKQCWSKERPVLGRIQRWDYYAYHPI
jgi:hypothetical protein